MALITPVTTVAAVNGLTPSTLINGVTLFEPPLGFGTAYSVGEPVWEGSKASRAVLTNIASSTDTFECFGPDANGNLVSLGTLNAGWVVTFGDLGSDEGAARKFPK